MTEVLVLDPPEAEKVRGRSPKDGGCALDPVPLKDGRFMLGEEVLDDPAHEDVRDFLAAMPREPLEKLPSYTEDDAAPEVVEVAKLSTRVGRIDATGAKVAPPEKTKTPIRGG